MDFQLSEEFASFCCDITISNIGTLTHFDLTNHPHHGGSTLSSGALPKWDLLDNTYLIKRCSIDSYGNFLSDAFNEELISRFCLRLGIAVANYRSVTVKYYDDEAHEVVICPAVITKIFDDLTHYRDIKKRLQFGTEKDELLDFAESFKINPFINDQLFIDYIFNQTDRHSKNMGVVGKRLSPLFDSGACLFYDILDSELTDSYFNYIPKHKTFGKKLDELLLFSLKYNYPGFSFEYDYNGLVHKFLITLSEMKHYYTIKRYMFIENLIKWRLENLGQILVKM